VAEAGRVAHVGAEVRGQVGRELQGTEGCPHVTRLKQAQYDTAEVGGQEGMGLDGSKD